MYARIPLMNWEATYQEFMAAELCKDYDLQERLIRQARTALQNRRLNDLEWLIAALTDAERKWFVARALARGRQMPRGLFAPMIRAAVYEVNPSFNRQFIEPCIWAFGPRLVNEALLDYLASGTDFEKAGAANALYWASSPLIGMRDVPDLCEEYEGLDDIRLRKRVLLLNEFVKNGNVDVRRSIIAQLSFERELYPPDCWPLLPQAVKVARDHPDEYIRHRVEVQLGSSGLLDALPHRRI
jgi:hypothetical protein